MTSSCRRKILFSVVALAISLCATNIYAAPDQQTLAEWLLGLRSYEQIFHKDFESLARRYLDDGPLQRFVPESAQDINVYNSLYSDQVIADYKFDKRDWVFFQEEWEELVDQSDMDHVLSVFRTCPWKRPLPEKGRYFRSVKEKRWDISGYVMINEDSLEAWYYWSVPQPARGSFCH